MTFSVQKSLLKKPKYFFGFNLWPTLESSQIHSYKWKKFSEKWKRTCILVRLMIETCLPFFYCLCIQKTCSQKVTQIIDDAILFDQIRSEEASVALTVYKVYKVPKVITHVWSLDITLHTITITVRHNNILSSYHH